MQMADIGTVNSLVAELQGNGRAKANNVVKLLALMTTCKQESALKSIIQGLKQFFVAAGQDGLLPEDAGAGAGGGRPAKRQKVGAGADAAPAAAAAAAAVPADAEAQYREWLGRQYGKYVRQLLALATGAAAGAGGAPLPAAARSAGVAVSAAAAVMECVRSEGGPGSFSGQLYGRLLAGLLGSPGARAEVFSLLFAKYLGMADVRFYTLATVRALASKYGDAALRGEAAAGEEEDEEEEEGAAGPSGATAAGAAALAAAAGGGGGGPGQGVSLPDLARNAFDVLSRLEPELPAEPAEWASWCGAAEYKLVSAAVDKNESARARRKRQQAEAEAGGQAKPAAARRAQWANPKAQKRLFGDAWLSLLSLPLPPDLLRSALLRLPASVLPALPAPLRLSDFLTHCLDRGGLTGMLALHGIFLLVTRHGLEYPRFYERLYQLLVPEAFAARSRSQFFRLADIFLSSALVPAYTVAAFVKRFARLALFASPPGACIAIAFIHNLIRRHPALYRMLHDPAGAAAAGAAAPPSGDGADGGASAGAAAGKGKGGKAAAAATGASGPGVDVYDEAEPDPAKSRAVESSLWEVEALRNHYCPQVSTFCAVLDKDLTDRTKTAEINLEDLLGGSEGQGGQQAGGASSYNALIGAELSRKLRKAPVAFYAQPPTGLFDPNLDGEDWGGWSFEPVAAES